MVVKNSKVLILGGFGLVGSAIARKLMEYQPKELIISSLKEEEAKSAVEALAKEYEGSGTVFTPAWGNLFTRTDWKDLHISSIYEDPKYRAEHIDDIFGDLTGDMLNSMFLHKLIAENKPDAVVDCINTATGIAYLDVYKTAAEVVASKKSGNMSDALVDKMVASSYIPQLIRHIQILGKSLEDGEVSMYLKIGTSGTGGMGMNIPYTHSEDRPSRVLMSKTAVAGAQTLLMYLMARTPNSTIVKEIKPTATIAWKKVAYGDITKGGRPIELVDMKEPRTLSGTFSHADKAGVETTGENLKSVFIDTGENGIFSRGEFEAISSLGQMELVTPEEIADYAVFELRGGNTGRDIIQGLDAFNLGPTYRAGFLQSRAVELLKQMESEHGDESVAFELLGPPRLSKLLFEIFLCKKAVGSLDGLAKADSEELSSSVKEYLLSNEKIRQKILSVGLPVLLDGSSYLRGETVKIPVNLPNADLELTEENVNKWCYQGWIDLRKENMKAWIDRAATIIDQAKSQSGELTGSRHFYTEHYWNGFGEIDGGKVAAWIFEHEDKGWRYKR
ncbi:MAG: hypothetical protein Kapaf2KO_10560 [Candidatus Kapaibacteriales bacterium]